MKKYYYSLTYTYTDKTGEHYFEIGYFSDKKMVKTVIEELNGKSGFKDCRGCFESKKFCVNFSVPVDKERAILYEVSHEYTDDSGYDCFTIFGVFATYAEAKAEQEKNETKIPFKNHLDGFCIAECKVNLYGWKEGFDSWRE